MRRANRVGVSVQAFRTIDVDPEFGVEVREVGLFYAPDEETARRILGKEWGVLRVAEIAWLGDLKKDLATASPFVRLEEGYNKIGLIVKEPPRKEEDERFGKRRITYLFKVRYHITPDGQRHDFEEPKLLRVSTRLMEELIKAIEAKLKFEYGTAPTPPEVIEVTIQRVGTDSNTRYKVVG